MPATFEFYPRLRPKSTQFPFMLLANGQCAGDLSPSPTTFAVLKLTRLSARAASRASSRRGTNSPKSINNRNIQFCEPAAGQASRPRRISPCVCQQRPAFHPPPASVRLPNAAAPPPIEAQCASVLDSGRIPATRGREGDGIVARIWQGPTADSLCCAVFSRSSFLCIHPER